VRVAVLSSGGKDSSYAHWWSIMQGWDVVALITCKIKNNDSFMFQIPCIDIVKTQAKVTNTEYIELIISGEENLEMYELEELILTKMQCGESLFGVEALISGALRSDYQKTRIERMCENLDLKSFSPLWHNDSEKHMLALISHGFEIMITAVSCEGLGEKWLGRIIDKSSIDELIQISKKYRFNVDGEGGEFETSVLDAPHFNSKINVHIEKKWLKSRGLIKFKSILMENNS